MYELDQEYKAHYDVSLAGRRRMAGLRWRRRSPRVLPAMGCQQAASASRVSPRSSLPAKARACPQGVRTISMLLVHRAVARPFAAGD